jgi:hypothetical protein
MVNITTRGWMTVVQGLSGFTPSNFAIVFGLRYTGLNLLTFGVFEVVQLFLLHGELVLKLLLLV